MFVSFYQINTISMQVQYIIILQKRTKLIKSITYLLYNPVDQTYFVWHKKWDKKIS